MVAWIVWLIVAAVLGVAELVTTTFALGIIAVAARRRGRVSAPSTWPALPVACLRGRLGGRARLRTPHSAAAYQAATPAPGPAPRP